MSTERFPWWAELRHGGMLIAPSRLPVSFPDECDPLPAQLSDRLRRELTRLDDATPEDKRSFVTTVLEKICGLNSSSGGSWSVGSEVEPQWSYRPLTGEVIKPRRVWKGPHGSVLPVFVDEVKTLGVGHGRRTVSRVVEWLRAVNLKIALVTNYYQWRLIYAGLDHDAWAEWDTALWFEEGRPGLQVDALRVLLSPSSLTPPNKNELSALLAAIDATRRGQAELSATLGERVRQAVELLIRSYTSKLREMPGLDPRALYIAACRVVMRLVVILFAESRDLLPRANPIYHDSYGLQGLREDLERHGTSAARERLRHQVSAWPRLLALFRLIHSGSCHEELPVLQYGGALFRPGDPGSTDPVLRSIAILEDRENAPDDFTVYQILQFLCRSTVRIRHGRGTTAVDAPVDFSDLSSEYIGILYEGLLDYELRRAETGEPVVFLALGDQPAFPLSRLDVMEEKAMASLVDKLKKSTKATLSDGDEPGDEEDDDQEELEDVDEELEEEPAAGEGEEISQQVSEEDKSDIHQLTRQRAIAWAKNAVVAGKLVKRPRKRNEEALAAYEQEVAAMAGRIISRVILPDEWYLIRWGGTRKGAGTFYTRPGLAVPTVHRTLRLLALVPPEGSDGSPDEDAPTSLWLPKKPEEILALKVCDPSMGSGSFLVAALRFLTDTLFKALMYHGWVVEIGGGRLDIPDLEGRPAWFKEVMSGLPDEPETAKARINARLKRVVVERCIYGVDIDPLAVELARLSLWVETMERELPFEFLDHKLKCGNALVGCWFDNFKNYPIMAWSREGGDKGHSTGVHYEKEAWTKAIRKKRAGAIDNLALTIETGARVYEEEDEVSLDALHGDAVALFDLLHDMHLDDQDEREQWYRENILESHEYRRLKQAFDTWCALWFWPADKLELSPMPSDFDLPGEEELAVVDQLAQELIFFHWELEFPDVFASQCGGFDAVLGNPPWEIQKPNSKEFFSNVDPLYRTYGKQDARLVQTEIFESQPEDELSWITYNSRLKALSNWCRWAGNPFGDDENLGRSFPQKKWLKYQARRKVPGYADTDHPFKHQGSADINTYKMFAELGHALLREGGIQGLIVPSGIYTDKGSTELRTLFLDQCRWLWLFGFENRQKIFEIDSRFKFCPIIVKKGGKTDAMKTAFMRHDLRDWEDGEKHVIPYQRAQVERFSPNTKAILEVRHPKDLEILEKIYSNSVLLGDQSENGWGIHYATEFHMTNDSHLFKPRPWWEERGYKPDEYGRWIGPDGDVALPLYQGVMVQQYDFSAKKWIQGTGLRAVWNEIGFENKRIGPQFLLSESDFTSNTKAISTVKIAFRDIARGTDERTFIAALIPSLPCGNVLGILSSNKQLLPVLACMNSISLDWSVRQRIGGTHLNLYVIEELPLIKPNLHLLLDSITTLVARLSYVSDIFSPYWLILYKRINLKNTPLGKHWAITTYERLRLRCVLDAIVAELYGLDWDDLAWILRDCDHPADNMGEKAFARTLDPKGFWRVDKEKDPELRHTVLTLVAFRDLKDMIAANGNNRDKGIEAFCSQNEGEGWMLPDTLRLADYGLGHDDRAKTLKPVRSHMGDRFLPWQLEQSVEESWAECERHAQNILGEAGFKKLMAEIRGEGSGGYSHEPEGAFLLAAEEAEKAYDKEGSSPVQSTLFSTKPQQGTLFGGGPPDKRGKKRK